MTNKNDECEEYNAFGDCVQWKRRVVDGKPILTLNEEAVKSGKCDIKNFHNFGTHLVNKDIGVEIPIELAGEILKNSETYNKKSKK
jgi:hypothetical protein